MNNTLPVVHFAIAHINGTLRSFNPIRTGGGGVLHQTHGFLPITLEVIKIQSRNLLTFPIIR